MLERASIKNTFILSAIFETQEDIEKNPFEFKTDRVMGHAPSEVPGCIKRGYMLRIEVSCNLN